MKKVFPKLARMFLEVLTEILRWAVIALIFTFIFRFVREIIDPLLVYGSYGEALRTLLDFGLFYSLYEGIKKIKSVLVLLFITLLGFFYVYIEKQIIKFIQQKYEIPAREYCN